MIVRPFVRLIGEYSRPSFFTELLQTLNFRIIFLLGSYPSIKSVLLSFNIFHKINKLA